MYTVKPVAVVSVHALSLGWCSRPTTIIAASILILSGRNEKFAYRNKIHYLL